MSHLWDLTNITAGGGNNEYEMSANDTGYVDVVANYDWKAQPIDKDWLTSHTPYIELTEFKLNRGTGLQRFLYNIQAAANSGGNALKTIDSKIGVNIYGELKNVAGIAKDSMNKIISKSNTLSSIMESTKGGFDYEKTVLAPYDKMYICNPTGWIFKFPYFADNPSKTPSSTYLNAFVPVPAFFFQ